MLNINDWLQRGCYVAVSMIVGSGLLLSVTADAEVLMDGGTYWATDFEEDSVPSFPSSTSVDWVRWSAWDTTVQLASDGSGQHVLRADKSGAGGATGARVVFGEDLLDTDVVTRGVAMFQLYVSDVSSSNEVEIFRAMKDPAGSITSGNSGFGIESRFSPTPNETRFRLWYGSSTHWTDIAIEQGVWYDISIAYDFTGATEDTFLFTISGGERHEEYLLTRETGRIGEIGGWITYNRGTDSSVYEFGSVAFAVPEPGSVSLFVVGSSLLLARRKNQ